MQISTCKGQVARKPYFCERCGEAITKGTYYYKVEVIFPNKLKEDNDIFTPKVRFVNIRCCNDCKEGLYVEYGE